MSTEPRKNSRKFYFQLKKSLDLSLICKAEASGKINSAQAARLRKLAINELRAAEGDLVRITVFDQSGASVGEVIQIKSELPWLATQLGDKWPAGEVFKEMAEAVAYLKKHTARK